MHVSTIKHRTACSREFTYFMLISFGLFKSRLLHVSKSYASQINEYVLVKHIHCFPNFIFPRKNSILLITKAVRCLRQGLLMYLTGAPRYYYHSFLFCEIIRFFIAMFFPGMWALTWFSTLFFKCSSLITCDVTRRKFLKMYA